MRHRAAWEAHLLATAEAAWAVDMVAVLEWVVIPLHDQAGIRVVDFSRTSTRVRARTRLPALEVVR